MAEFKVDTAQLRAQAEEIRSLQSGINEVAVKLSGMQLGSVIQIKASTALMGKVTKCKWAAVSNAYDLGRLATGLDNAAELYDNTEKKLSEPTTMEEAQKKEQQDSAGFDWKNLAKIFGDMSPIANLVTAVAYGVDAKNGGGASSAISLLKSVVKAAGSIGKVAKDGTEVGWASELLGLKAANAGMGETSFKAFLDKGFGDYKISGSNTIGSNIKAVAKWAGVALTLAGNAVSNYDEFGGDLSNGRFWEETVVETGIDIVKGIAISAAISACIGAAPAAAVAVLAGGVAVAADWVCEKVTKKKVTELVSDTAIDIAHGVRDGVSALWNSVVRPGRYSYAGGGGA